jgi:hypothetical protein
MRIRRPRVYELHFRHPKRVKKPPRPYSPLISRKYFSIHTSYTSGWATGGIPEERRVIYRTDFSDLRQYGQSTKDYRRLISEGKSATTAAQGVKHRQLALGWYDWDLRIDGSDAAFNPLGLISRLSGNYAEGAIPSPSAFVDLALEDQAKSMFIRKARKVQTSALTGEFMRDISKTLDSYHKTRDIFGRAFSRVTKLNSHLAKFARGDHNLARTSALRTQFLGIRNPRGRNRRDASKAMANNWLEFSYGIAPTVADLEDQSFGIWRAYTRSQFGEDAQYVRGWAKDIQKSSASDNLSNDTPSGSSKPRIYIRDSTIDEKFIAFYGSVRTLRSDSMVSNLQNEFGLGLRSFVPTIWEIVPYSFVVDYFTNVGQMIDAFVFPRSDVLWINKLVRRTVTTTRSFEKGFAIPLNPGSVLTKDNFSTSPLAFSCSVWSREAYSGSLVPSFRWHLPYRGTDWVNLFALGLSRFIK